MLVTVSFDEYTEEIGRTNRRTKAIDVSGQGMAVGQQSRLLRVDRKVDVTFNPTKSVTDSMQVVREIRMLEGKLADPIQ
jgi:hypothetical protein